MPHACRPSARRCRASCHRRSPPPRSPASPAAAQIRNNPQSQNCCAQFFLRVKGTHKFPRIPAKAHSGRHFPHGRIAASTLGGTGRGGEERGGYHVGLGDEVVDLALERVGLGLHLRGQRCLRHRFWRCRTVRRRHLGFTAGRVAGGRLRLQPTAPL